jgi:hypothetical protein
MTAVTPIPPTSYATPAVVPGLLEAVPAAAEVILHCRDHVPDHLPVRTVLTEQPVRDALIDEIGKATTISW